MEAEVTPAEKTIEEKRSSILQTILDATTKFSTENTFPERKSSGLTAHEASVLNAIIQNGDVCTDYKRFALNIADAILQTEGKLSKAFESSTEPSGDEVKFTPFCAVKLDGNPNSHNYPFGRVIILPKYGKHSCLYLDGEDLDHGNNITDDSGCVYPATETEITEFVNSLDDEKVEAIAEAME